MTFLLPTIIALDFDGVICDGLREYFATTKRAYEQIWQQKPEQKLEELEISFYRLRPVIKQAFPNQFQLQDEVGKKHLKIY